jgi:hypothetical protein
MQGNNQSREELRQERLATNVQASLTVLAELVKRQPRFRPRKTDFQGTTILQLHHCKEIYAAKFRQGVVQIQVLLGHVDQESFTAHCASNRSAMSHPQLIQFTVLRLLVASVHVTQEDGPDIESAQYVLLLEDYPKV